MSQPPDLNAFIGKPIRSAISFSPAPHPRHFAINDPLLPIDNLIDGVRSPFACRSGRQHFTVSPPLFHRPCPNRCTIGQNCRKPGGQSIADDPPWVG
jgi:hypothetical protein